MRGGIETVHVLGAFGFSRLCGWTLDSASAAPTAELIHKFAANRRLPRTNRSLQAAAVVIRAEAARIGVR